MEILIYSSISYWEFNKIRRIYNLVRNYPQTQIAGAVYQLENFWKFSEKTHNPDFIWHKRATRLTAKSDTVVF